MYKSRRDWILWVSPEKGILRDAGCIMLNAGCEQPIQGQEVKGEFTSASPRLCGYFFSREDAKEYCFKCCNLVLI